MERKIRVKKTKQEFILRMQAEVRLRTALVKFINEVFLPTLKKFDGKVYNKRFIAALESAEFPYEVRVQEEHDKSQLIFSIKHVGSNYNDVERLYHYVKRNGENRIDYAATVADEMSQKWLEGFKNETATRQQMVDNPSCYEVYLQTAQAVEDAIQAYAALPYRFRDSVIDGGFSTYYLR